MITLNFQKNWHIRTPHLFRYMNREYIEKFFDTGKLMLSSFRRFSEHDDAMRNDGIEGKNVVSVRGKNGLEDRQEYRFIWNVAHEVAGTIEIDCPAAKQYCEWKRE